MLTVQSISKAFGGVHALNYCSLHIKPQTVTALIGPNGAGKTTLFDVISGLVPPDSGSIAFAGSDITGLPAAKRARMGISRTWQQIRLFKHLTIADHLCMAEQGSDFTLSSSFFQNRSYDQTYYQEQLEKFGIERELDTLVSDLSFGQGKLLQILMAVLRPHSLLLLDEPVAGVNQVVQQRIESLLPKLKEEGETIVIIEHDIEFVKKLADHVIVLHQGSVLVDGTPGDVLKDKRVLEAYLGE